MGLGPSIQNGAVLDLIIFIFVSMFPHIAYNKYVLLYEYSVGTVDGVAY